MGFDRIVWCVVLCVMTLSAGFFSGCSSVPYTGRTQMMMVSESSEVESGASAWNELKKTEKIYNNAAMQSQLQKVAVKIVKAAGLEKYSWEYTVFDNATPNAFVLPGGKMGFYNSIFPYFANEAELAAVAGHEVGHVLARHGAERATQSGVMETILAGMSATEYTSGWVGLAGAAGQVGFMLPYSRSHESEADKIGMILMAKAGYNPEAAISFWNKFGSSSAGIAKYLSTHPDGPDRINDLKAFLPEAKKYYTSPVANNGLGNSMSFKVNSSTGTNASAVSSSSLQKSSNASKPSSKTPAAAKNRRK